MSDVKYEAGVFCWIDLMAHDMEAAKRFYSQLFGWEMTPTDENMHYSNAMQGGEMIAGIGGMPPDMKSQGVPPMWNSYAWTDDAAKVEAAARENGAKIIAPTMQVAEYGSMMCFMDPGGAPVGVWQPGTHRGAGIVNKPNSLCWNELVTRDVEGCKSFYAKVLGWTYEAMPMGDFDYEVVKVGERSNGGIMPMSGEMWEGIPSHWMVYFAVADTDAIARKCEQLGGKIMVPPTDMQVGRFAVLQDAQGAVFSVLKLAEQPAS
jgi:predicted enzyme related to lactoylglutathione lyase